MLGHALMWLLDLWFRVLFRRQWVWGERPHFMDHRHDVWGLLTGRGSPWALYRGLRAAEVMDPGDIVLDIGCGDGFFTQRFFASRAAEVDGIDVEPSAIEHARRHYPAPNVRFLLCDAVNDKWPRSHYDVVVWDGGIAHLSRDDAEVVLKEIASMRATFCGSEALQDTSPDHLQIFDSPDDIRGLMDGFAHVEVATLSYAGRTEVYWRCH